MKAYQKINISHKHNEALLPVEETALVEWRGGGGLGGAGVSMVRHTRGILQNLISIKTDQASSKLDTTLAGTKRLDVQTTPLRNL